MKNTDIGFEKFEEDFIADLNTMYIKPENKDSEFSQKDASSTNVLPKRQIAARVHLRPDTNVSWDWDEFIGTRSQFIELEEPDYGKDEE